MPRIGLLKFYVFPLFSFGRLYFSKNLFISSKLSILLAIVAHSSFLWPFVFLCYLCKISPFSFLILLIQVLFFLFMSLVNNLSILCISLKNQLLILLVFALSSFLFHLLLLWSLISSTNFGVFALLILVALGIKLGYFFDVSLISWGRLVLLWTSLLALLLLNPIGSGLLCFHYH